MNKEAAGERVDAILAHLKLGIGAALVALLVLFSVQNAQQVQVAFLVWEGSLSLALVVFWALLSGVLFGLALAGYLRRRSRRLKAG